MKELRRRHEAGVLRQSAERFFSPVKPVEELYDTAADPHEMNNLAADPRHKKRLLAMRAVHLAWVKETGDLGLIAEPLLVDLEKKIGHRYGILRSEGGEELAQRTARAAVSASGERQNLSALIDALGDEAAAVRYWGTVGIANIGKAAARAEPAVRQALLDSSPVVQTAAAYALCRLGKPADALPVLTSVLANGGQWERLHAAIVLDEIDEQARPVIDELRKALQPRKELYAAGKYTVRVVNRALNQLEGTHRNVR